MNEEVYLRDLRPGAVFVTREGIYAVKSEYFYTGDSESQCECVLLASGEYAHFRDGNRTLVREATVAGLVASVTGPSTELLGERDTHFAGFAKLLWREMLDLKGGYIDESDGYYRGSEEHPEYEALIARRAYDLAQHVREDIRSRAYELDFPSLHDVPDLTEWPVEPDESSGSNPA